MKKLLKSVLILAVGVFFFMVYVLVSVFVIDGPSEDYDPDYQPKFDTWTETSE